MKMETETETLSSYEECRRKRIEENKKRLEELNLTHLANSLSRKSNHHPVAKPSSSTPATKRGRGRPKGRPSEEKQQPKRGRGRPRKGRPSEEEEEEKQKPVPVGVRRSLRTCNLPAPDYSKTSTSMKSDVSVSVPPLLSRSEKMEVSVSVLSSYSRSKKVVVACIPPDGYSWRRGGRQLTRGSTDPRRWYYICSSVEGCPARKHVEWAVDDPSMLIVTYKSYHTHPSVSVTAPAAAAALVLEPS